jgi:hypothetical protein
MRFYSTLLLPLTFFLFLTFSAVSQGYKAETFHLATQKSAKAFIVKYKSDLHSFSITVEGNRIVEQPPHGQQNYLSVDNNVLQFLVVPFPVKADYLNFDDEKKKEFLSEYEEYEMSYIKDALKVTDLNKKLQFIDLNGRLFLFWFYDMPGRYQVRQQCYLITVCYDQMLVLNAPVSTGEDMLAKKDFLCTVGKSLKLSKP